MDDQTHECANFLPLQPSNKWIFEKRINVWGAFTFLITAAGAAVGGILFLNTLAHNQTTQRVELDEAKTWIKEIPRISERVTAIESSVAATSKQQNEALSRIEFLIIQGNKAPRAAVIRQPSK